jgi:hypothetical protein
MYRYPVADREYVGGVIKRDLWQLHNGIRRWIEESSTSVSMEWQVEMHVEILNVYLHSKEDLVAFKLKFGV